MTDIVAIIGSAKLMYDFISATMSGANKWKNLAELQAANVK
jgi:hypothetical protein